MQGITHISSISKKVKAQDVGTGQKEGRTDGRKGEREGGRCEGGRERGKEIFEPENVECLLAYIITFLCCDKTQ